MLTDLPTGPIRAAATPATSVPIELTRKRLLIMRSGPLPLDPLQSASDVNPADQTQPNLSVPGNPCGYRDVLKYYHSWGLIGSPNRLGPPRRSEPGRSPRHKVLPESAWIGEIAGVRRPRGTIHAPGIRGRSRGRPSAPAHIEYRSCQVKIEREHDPSSARAALPERQLVGSDIRRELALAEKHPPAVVEAPPMLPRLQARPRAQTAPG
jgi:hypothetical protein